MKIKDLEHKIGQMQYEISLLGLSEEELTGVSLRTNELKDLVKKMSVMRSSTELKDKETQAFYKWLEDNKYTRANSLIWQKNNEYYGEIGLFKRLAKLLFNADLAVVS